MLGCFGPEDQDRTSISKIPKFDEVSWISGKQFKFEIPIPIELELDPENQGIMMPMYDKGILLFSDVMIEALRDAGVDNFDCYDVVIWDPITKRKFQEYKAVNIIGVISCADLTKSKYSMHDTPSIDVDFDSLVIDETKTHGALMFRLAECVTGIVVHEKVKEVLLEKGIKHLDFDHPEEWIG
jgi:hypothetical protein